MPAFGITQGEKSMRTNLWSIYRKCVIIAMISVGVYLTGYSDAASRPVAAAPCIQECETNQGSCIDACQEICGAEDGTESGCQSCVIACNSQFLTCLGNAVWCENEEATPGVCATQYGSVCDVNPNTGQPQNCRNRYYLTCPWFGGGTCVNCFGKYCYGGGMPPC